MFQNFLQTTFRNLWKNKLYSLINIGGLAVGMMASILLFLWVQEELSYNSFHQNTDRLYRVVTSIGTADSKQTWASSTASLAPFAAREIPGIEQTVRFIPNWEVSLFTYQDKKFKESTCAYADPSFFTLFNFPFVKGNPQQPFPNNQSIIITESIASKYFGKEDPIGKVIRTNDKEDFMISGVIKNIPANSSIQFDIFFPFDILVKRYTPNIYWKSLETDWGNFGYQTYFLLSPNASLPAIEQKLTGLQRKHNAYDHSSVYSLQAFSTIHLYHPDGSDGRIQMVRIFFIVALVILLIACINYVNLATARATNRAKEVSIRKIIGANRPQLLAQFLGESAFTVLSALLLALLLIQWIIPAYNELTDKHMVLRLTDPTLLTTVGMTLFATLLLAGIYPALLLSSFQPLQVMKGKLLAGSGNASFRKILVVTQFTFSVALIISNFIIGSQLQYIRSKELGYTKENVFTVDMRGEMNKHYQGIKSELLKQPGVMEVTSAAGNLLQIGNSTGDTDWDGKAPKSTFMVHAMAIEEDFLEMFDMHLTEGQNFTGSKADSTHYILNETAVKQAGIQDPIGKRFKLWVTEGTIIGVVKDFHFSSMHNKIEPAVFLYRPEWHWQLYIKTTGKEAPKAIAAAEKLWKQYNPAFPFEYKFMDQAYDQMYKSDQRTGKLFNYFAAITIIISCLGLFGLATYTAEQRTKEIGIRKVLGASVSNITLLLSKDFLKLVLIAFLIATPIAWYLMNQWLENFAYQIDISFWVFLLAGFLAIVIALLTVSYQAIKAALANPVKSLRNE
ncbi:ABC transporter permease [Rhodocytophaga aerolata]|uniref:ABC transporter permease n=1 Tax=Rhodocytophaga aerolata TaxID=455078 RepID=A0ABT8RIW9_9BACT|nr:ABC transporter permease [Rhodocytophaga aerolata]MDO1451661.1 ABC transporter permease [Rhodocytophaga aerolata]